MEEDKSVQDSPKEPEKNAFQRRKENFYDGLNITVRQLDIVILLCLGVIAFLTLRAALS